MLRSSNTWVLALISWTGLNEITESDVEERYIPPPVPSPVIVFGCFIYVFSRLFSFLPRSSCKKEARESPRNIMPTSCLAFALPSVSFTWKKKKKLTRSLTSFLYLRLFACAPVILKYLFRKSFISLHIWRQYIVHFCIFASFHLLATMYIGIFCK